MYSGKSTIPSEPQQQAHRTRSTTLHQVPPHSNNNSSHHHHHHHHHQSGALLASSSSIANKNKTSLPPIYQDQVASTSSTNHRSYSFQNPQPSSSYIPTRASRNVNPLGIWEHHSQARYSQAPQPPSPKSPSLSPPSSELYHLSSDEVEECDRYNPLVLHRTRRQCVHRNPKDHPSSSRKDLNTDRKPAHLGRHLTPEAQPRQGLLYRNGSWQMSENLASVPRVTSPPSTTTSMTSAHAIISPSSSYCSPSSSKASSSGSSTKDLHGSHHPDSRPQEQGQAEGNSGNRRMSLPGQAWISSSTSRGMSTALGSPPRLLGTIFQRVYQTAEPLPIPDPPSGALMDEDLKTVEMSDSEGSNPIQATPPQAWNPPGSDQSTPSGTSRTMGSNYSSSPYFFTGNDRPLDQSNRSLASRMRFINQVTFSLDESHKSGLKAILALRTLTHGLTSSEIPPTPRSDPEHPRASPTIPIPKISHRYPESCKTLKLSNQQTVLVIDKVIPLVVVDWSDGSQEQFDPSGLSVEEILQRLHFHPPA